MKRYVSAGLRPASTIEAAFAHAEAFDFIDLRLAFDGMAFSSSPSTNNSYDGPWEDFPCEHADFSVHFSSVFCAFGDFVKFLEAIAVGVEQCQFSWDAEGPDGSFSWQRASRDGSGFLAVAWHSRPSFRYVARIDGKSAVRALYGAFREFVGSDAYDPLRYERITTGETISLVLEKGDLDRFPAELAKLEAAAAEALLSIVEGGPDERPIRGPKRRYSLTDCLGHVAEVVATRKELGDVISQWRTIPAEWDGWTEERRIEEIAKIMGWEGGSWYGANLRTMRSPILEAWLAEEEGALTQDEAVALVAAERESARDCGLTTFAELEIYPDFTHAWAFVAGDHEDAGMAIGDGHMWSGEPELPYGLIAKLAKWQEKFGTAPFDADLFVVMDWESFHAEGLALATEVKRALGDGFAVRYAKAFEDRNRTEPTTVEIHAGRAGT